MLVGSHLQVIDGVIALFHPVGTSSCTLETEFITFSYIEVLLVLKGIHISKYGQETGSEDLHNAQCVPRSEVSTSHPDQT